jgi:predicted dehydrogenase
LFALTGSSSNLELEVEDTAEISVAYRSGALATVHLDYVQRPPRHDLEIIGDEGSIQWSNASAAARVYRAGTGEWQEELPPAGFERNTLFLDELRHFINVAKMKAEPVCDLNDGITALTLAESAYRSALNHEYIQF